MSITGVGALTTRPIVFEGDRLEMNATGVDRYAGANWGTVAVEILDAETGTPLAGFSKNDCDTFGDDAVDHVVTWQGRRNIGRLAGRPIKLRFHIDQAKLFSFTFAPS